MILSGVIVNSVAVGLGSLLGVFFRNKFNKKIIDTVMSGMGLCVLYIGISGSLKGQNILVAIGSIALGGIIGELIDIDHRLRKFGLAVEAKFKSDTEESLVEGFLNATMVICVGAMAIVGSLQSGLIGNHEILYAKAFIDLFVVLAMSATMGIGVFFSAFLILFYEGAIVLFAGTLSPFLSALVIDEITCVGSLVIMAIGFNILGITKIKVANLSLAPFIPIFIYLFM
ncbi:MULTISPECIES: DUF554 domain-containing protein [Psychrilyobacter]|uniref:DUF554 family protein n=1 Tax=Psychrilyobacter piezotolerans TaxID=2293438 RepID=A0ABX9KG15_9FUSO|nr:MULTISPECIES: DUF554 domain-containing protein [Psychrilyobacter]MCS5422913.1 DUF554 domain-containing protein [Psychrilyobacter sp. S5]NDI78429.1 DUF554 domain-containing protein [Psychrilyobacter piezotolerans]RDE61153.1 DUF554 domain-containing protein [Psychrilyobacter sp. S5]REI40794.1 DUF554 family protein [Psychrilyobacter piezotolerans]